MCVCVFVRIQTAHNHIGYARVWSTCALDLVYYERSPPEDGFLCCTQNGIYAHECESEKMGPNNVYCSISTKKEVSKAWAISCVCALGPSCFNETKLSARVK